MKDRDAGVETSLYSETATCFHLSAPYVSSSRIDLSVGVSAHPATCSRRNASGSSLLTPLRRLSIKLLKLHLTFSSHRHNNCQQPSRDLESWSNDDNEVVRTIIPNGRCPACQLSTFADDNLVRIE